MPDDVSHNINSQSNEEEQANLAPTDSTRSAYPLAQQDTNSLETIIMGNIQGLYLKTNQTKVSFLDELAAEKSPMFIAIRDTSEE